MPYNNSILRNDEGHVREKRAIKCGNCNEPDHNKNACMNPCTKCKEQIYCQHLKKIKLTINHMGAYMLRIYYLVIFVVMIYNTLLITR